MRAHHLHGWHMSPQEAKSVQRRLAGLVSRRNEVSSPQFVAGVDISSPDSSGVATGAVVVLRYPDLMLVEVKTHQGRLDFPYVPGLLSFREAPLVLAACEKLALTPDLLLVDGQGIAHPRRVGLASHLGLLLDVPCIGCAKSVLCGQYDTLGEEKGSWTELIDQDEVVGAAVRTKGSTNPIYVSIGHKVDLPAAIHWVQACCRQYRLPEPTRLAHLAAGGALLEIKPREHIQG